MQKKIQIGDKKYTLTANRRILKTLYAIAPDMLKLDGTKKSAEDLQAKIGIDLVTEIDRLFYDMIKVVHKDITREKSDEIFDKFDSEYEDVQTELLNLAMSVFTTGDQKKKKVIWED